MGAAGIFYRALVNWGKALVGRAELAADHGAASKLYNAAIDKFEAVLEEDPEMLVAKYRCALAMQVRRAVAVVALWLGPLPLTDMLLNRAPIAVRPLPPPLVP